MLDLVDPFLFSHKIGPRQFYIGARFSPYSLRDTMLRATLIVDRMAECGLVSPTDTLLIAGAGVAGVTAAMRAVGRYGIRTVVVDKAVSSFRNLLEATTRFIDPTQYDFPLPHWTNGEIPNTFPLEFRANTASNLATAWKAEWSAFQFQHQDLLTVAYCKEWQLPSTENDATEIMPVLKEAPGRPSQSPRSDSPLKGPFGAALYCTGYENEFKVNTKHNGFKASPFWGSDQFEELGFGIKDKAHPRILISGAGDGALQDFLRLVTGLRSVKDIYHAVLNGTPGLSSEKMLQLLAEEEYVYKTYLWGWNNSHDHVGNQLLHSLHRRLIDGLWSGYNGIIQANIEKLTRQRLQSVTIDLVFPCDHFARSYCLNRLLAALFLKYFETNPNANVRCIPNLALTSITSAAPGHNCKTDVQGCSGQAHKVEFSVADCLTDLDGAKPRGGSVEYDLIVLRHGIDKGWQPSTPLPMVRQALPHSLALFDV